ncbi:MAG: DUF1285 domain-containing protein [Hyphomonadaceae bacterium]|nr:DUF1285 domain-containing protein [Hyphomonadaceae bacterium]
MQSHPRDSLSQLLQGGDENAPFRPRPVERWNPQRCGDIGLEILADGTWRHEGAPIPRPALVRLFASILRRDPDGFYLVTPVEKVVVRVADAPFVIVSARREGEGAAQRVGLCTNVGEEFVLDAAHPLRVAADAGGGPRPYVMVRAGLEALIARSVYYDLAEWGAPGPSGEGFGVWSGGAWLALG